MIEIKPIKTETAYDEALKEIEKLFEAKVGTPEGDRLEMLGILVEDYENQHYRIPEPDPIEALQYHIESRGLTLADLEPYLGERTVVSEVLNKERPLSLEMIRKLHQGLGMLAETLIQPYALTTSK